MTESTTAEFRPVAPCAGPASVSDESPQSSKWDTIAEQMPDFFHARSTQYYRACEIALLRREIGSLAGKRVLKLDLWNEAINTRILHWMDSEGAQAVGLDLSHVVTFRALRNSLQNHSRPHLTRADIREVPFRTASFDVVYTMGTIEHIDEYDVALAEICRVLKPGGRAIIGVPYRWDIFLRPLLVAFLEAIGRYPYAPEKSFSASALRREIEAAGLEFRSRTGILAMPGVLRMLDLFLYSRGSSLVRATEPIISCFESLERRWRWIARFGYLLTIVADKPR